MFIASPSLVPSAVRTWQQHSPSDQKPCHIPMKIFGHLWVRECRAYQWELCVCARAPIISMCQKALMWITDCKAHFTSAILRPTEVQKHLICLIYREAKSGQRERERETEKASTELPKLSLAHIDCTPYTAYPHIHTFWRVYYRTLVTFALIKRIPIFGKRVVYFAQKSTHSVGRMNALG